MNPHEETRNTCIENFAQLNAREKKRGRDKERMAFFDLFEGRFITCMQYMMICEERQKDNVWKKHNQKPRRRS